MKLIIDTNILISSLLKDSINRELLLNEFFEFYLPEIVLREVNKYLPYITQKSKLSEEEIKKLLNILLENLNLVPIDGYKGKMNEGLEIIGNIDEKSIPSNFAIHSSSSMVSFFILIDRELIILLC